MIDIIPAIDIMDGKAVRLSQGNYASKIVYDDDPVEILKRFERLNGSEGFDFGRLHVVDLDGAKAGKLVNLNILERLALATDLVIDYSGGIKSMSDVEQVFKAGAGFVSIGTMAVKDPGEVMNWMDRFGPGKFLIGADVKGDKVAVRGWLEQGPKTVFELIGEFVKAGINSFFCTDISRDGMMAGPGIDLYKKILSAYPDIDLIASGGVRDIKDVKDLEAIGCSGAIVGKAFCEGKFFAC